MSKITVGFSTRTPNPTFVDYLKSSSGLKDINVIQKVNVGSKSLSQVYNEIINESESDIVVLCHDDLYFDSKNWGEKLVKQFEKNTHSILGVAGTTYLPSSGQWWEDQSKMIGIVNHEHQGKKWESKYSENLDNQIKNVVIVDGLFIALKKSEIKELFDESVSGFHMYDVNFCFKNYIQNVKIGVVFNIRITHKSIGQTNEQWEKNRKIFSERYTDYLPAKVKFDFNDKIKIMFAIKNIDNFIKISNLSFFENKDVVLITDTIISKETKKTLHKKGIKVYKLNEIPGYKLGDGRSLVKTENGLIKTEPNSYYKISNQFYDIIVIDNFEYFNIIKILHSNIPKIFINTLENKVVEHDSIQSQLELEKIETLPSEIIKSLNSLPEKKQKVKILTGYSERGGSTTALINLTNYFNKNGLDTTLYGPNKWHLDKCKSDLLQNLKLDKSDKVITHYLQLKERPRVDRVLLTSHELNWFPVGKIPVHWDEVIFLHEKHRNFHSDYTGEFRIIPNFRESLTKGQKKDGVENVCGVIGTIETRKQTHKSIERALNDGCDKVLLFGKIGEQDYFDKFVQPLLSDGRVEIMGFSEDKQDMYNSIGKVYHSSMGEVACLVKDECYFTDTEFFGNEQTEHEVSEISNEEILNLWKKALLL